MFLHFSYCIFYPSLRPWRHAHADNSSATGHEEPSTSPGPSSRPVQDAAYLGARAFVQKVVRRPRKYSVGTCVFSRQGGFLAVLVEKPVGNQDPAYRPGGHDQD